MHIVPDQALGEHGPALWKVLVVGIVLGVVICRVFDLGPVRVVRFVDLPKPEGGR